jgi:thiamine-monophosphate kinase
MPEAREFEIIERFFTRPLADPAVTVGIGDDAAVVVPSGPIAIAVDTLVAGTHFPDNLEARAIGHRSLAVNLSDLAAVGATPRWATLTLTLSEVEETWLEDFATGFFALAERYGVALIGGDTTRGPLSVTVQAIGEQRQAPLVRSGGRIGDRIFVSGTLGAAAAALHWFDGDQRRRSPEASALIERFSYPEPRVDLGLALSGLANAAIDISDGLVADLRHLAAQSHCGAVIDLDTLPMTDALRSLYEDDVAVQFALNGGDDYELCFSVAPADADRVREAAGQVGTPVTEIGELTASGKIEGRRDGSSIELVAEGFVHFR